MTSIKDFEPISDQQWPAGTIVELCRVPWDAQYRHIVEFSNRAAQRAYIAQRTETTHRIDRNIYIRPYAPVRVSLPVNTVLENNYVRVHNPAHPVTNDVAMDFYYFILDARHVAPNTTELVLQLDVWQTYGHFHEPGHSYVERGHVGIANRNNDYRNGKQMLTVPEGLDVGNEYNIIHTVRENIADTNTCGVIVWSTVHQYTNPKDPGYGDEDNPKLHTATGSTFEGVPNGANAYYFKTLDAFKSWISGLSLKPWASQGIIAVQAVPDLYRYNLTVSSGSDMMGLSMGETKPIATTVAANWRNTVRNRLPEKYRHLDKLLTYPYTVIELTTNTGAPLILKPEQLQGSDIEIAEIPYFAQPSPRIIIHPKNYNKHHNANTPSGQHDGGEYLDFTTGIYDFPTFSVVNNGYMSFMASNRHGIQHQFDAADWSHSKALRGADQSFDQATMGMNAADAMTENQLSQMRGSHAIADQYGATRAGLSGLTSIGQGSLGGGPGLIAGTMNAATTGLGEAVARSERAAQQALAQGGVQQGAAIQSQLAGGIRDSNHDLATWAARGDYAQAQAALNARVQDAKMIQPTISGQMGGEAFNLAKDQWGYDVKIKTLHDGALRVIGDFWLRYGYAVNAALRPSRLQVMEKFSYWKFQEYTIRDSIIPEQYKNVIRGIFEKGVTVWGNPDDIGYTKIDNNPPIIYGYYG